MFFSRWFGGWSGCCPAVGGFFSGFGVESGWSLICLIFPTSLSSF